MPEITLTAALHTGFPRLAWFAELNAVEGRCHLEHGCFVEVDPDPAGPRWIAAAVWEGPFREGNFHRCEHVFGSGVRVDDDRIHFVAPSTTLDRLFYLRTPGRVFVSNSLVVLLARLDIRLSPDHNHQMWGEGPCLGRFEYRSDIAVVGNGHEVIRQVVFESLVVENGDIRLHDRTTVRSFAGYHDYLDSLTASLQTLWNNATDAARRRSARAISTASRGYDSPAVTALVAKLTAVDCYSAAKSSTRIPKPLRRFLDDDVADDDGSNIAAHLGTRPIRLDLPLAGLPRELEQWLWASAQVAPELVFSKLFVHAERSEDLTLWFSGQGGDSVWEVRSYDPRIPTGSLYRGAPSGIALAEARLRYGVIDCAVPYLFASSIGSILQINRSIEMGPWRLNSDYDRPIARRILEDRGVPREWFGFGKKMVAQDFDSPQGDLLRADFFAATGWNAISERAYRGFNLGLYGTGRLYALLLARGDRIKMMDHYTADKTPSSCSCPTWDCGAPRFCTAPTPWPRRFRPRRLLQPADRQRFPTPWKSPTIGPWPTTRTSHSAPTSPPQAENNGLRWSTTCSQARRSNASW